jgi:hypothetical protein
MAVNISYEPTYCGSKLMHPHASLQVGGRIKSSSAEIPLHDLIRVDVAGDHLGLYDCTESVPCRASCVAVSLLHIDASAFACLLMAQNLASSNNLQGEDERMKIMLEAFHNEAYEPITMLAELQQKLTEVADREEIHREMQQQNKVLVYRSAANEWDLRQWCDALQKRLHAHGICYKDLAAPVLADTAADLDLTEAENLDSKVPTSSKLLDALAIRSPHLAEAYALEAHQATHEHAAKECYNRDELVIEEHP